jgi:hypothetical protein
MAGEKEHGATGSRGVAARGGEGMRCRREVGRRLQWSGRGGHACVEFSGRASL